MWSPGVEVSTAAAGAGGQSTLQYRSWHSLFVRRISSETMLWRRWWTHHAPPGGTGLLSATRVGSASSVSSLRCQGQARAQRGPTPPAGNTGAALRAEAQAGTPDTPPLAPPRRLPASWGLGPRHGSGVGWRAPRGCGTVRASPGAPGWPSSRRAAAWGNCAGARAASGAAGIPRPRASGCAGGGRAGSLWHGTAPGHPLRPRAGGARWRCDGESEPGR